MAKSGSLIQLHSHTNLEILEFLSDVDDNLYYKGIPIYTQVSSDRNNAIKKLPDGIFVDNSILSRLSAKDDKIYFDNKLITQEYTENEIQNMITGMWNILEPKTGGDSSDAG